MYDRAVDPKADDIRELLLTLGIEALERKLLVYPKKSQEYKLLKKRTDQARKIYRDYQTKAKKTDASA